MIKRELYILMIGISGLFFLFGCKKEEKILQKTEKQTIEGTWYSNKIVFDESINDAPPSRTDFEDAKPLIIETVNDNLSSQIEFKEDGTYQSLSHRLMIYFALIGNVKGRSYRNDGVWQFADNGKQLYFDQGVYEFEGSSPRYFTITLLSPDSLKLETNNPKAIYDWAFLNGQTSFTIDEYPQIQNVAQSNNSLKPGGLELAEKFAFFEGYLDTTKSEPVEFDPFRLGFRKGSVEAFRANQDTIAKYKPIAISAFNTNYDANFKDGKTFGGGFISNRRKRAQKLTFIFSRKPNAE
jgi:hypothetical protein